MYRTHRYRGAGGGAFGQGFSLIEILVVIAIISLLMGLVLPVLSQARDRGRAAVCASNLKQLTTVTLIYVNDDPRKRFPKARFPIAPWHPTNPFDSWVYTMKPYVDTHDLAVCPSDASPYWETPPPWFPGRVREVSYGINSIVSDDVLLLERRWPSVPRFGESLEEIDVPSNTIVYGELTETSGIVDYIFAPHFGTDVDGNIDFQFRLQVEVTRHGNVPQWSFVDGHVEPFRRKDVYDPGTYDEITGTGEWTHNKFHPKIAR